MPRSKVLAALLSMLLPGAGHLYLGLSQAGLALMGAFFGCIVLIAWGFSALLFMFGMVVIWFYALFDAMQGAERGHMAGAQGPQPTAASAASAQRFSRSLEPAISTESVPWLGGALIVVGLVMFIQVLRPDWWSAAVRSNGALVAVALFVMAFGARLIAAELGLIGARRRRSSAAADRATEDSTTKDGDAS